MFALRIKPCTLTGTMLLALSMLVPNSPVMAQVYDDAMMRPHLARPVRYEGLLHDNNVDPDDVELLEKWPNNLAPMGRAKVIVVDSRQPDHESAEFLLKKIGAQVGANIVKVTKLSDVTKDFRSLKVEKKRGVSALEEFEVAAIIAKANMGGGELRIGQFKFFITAADRYGDSDVGGAFHLTLSHSDTLQWSIGRVGPHYHVVQRSKRLNQITGPSGKKYDVRIVGRRAKVYPAGLKTELKRKRLHPSELKEQKGPQLYYGEFSIIVALRESTGASSSQ